MADNKTLTTERLILRAARPDDAGAFASGIGDYEVARFLTRVPYPYTESMAAEWIASLSAISPDNAHFIIERRDMGLIGCITLVEELGFWLTRSHWGQGYMTEAAAALLDWHFAETDSIGVASSVHWDNPASLAVQQKLGFEQVGFDDRFAEAQQKNVRHITTFLSRAHYMNRGERS